MNIQRKIGLIDADLLDNGTRHPNLALMKISAYHKAIGTKVSLLLNYNELELYDDVFISKVFSFTNIPVNLEDYSNVIKGGTGFFEDGGPSLPYEIEHHMPDYNLYKEYIDLQVSKGRKMNYFKDYINYSIGFTTRGCFRKCEFCVNKKYNKAFKHSPISEFVDENRKGIYLWDDNFLAYSGWEEVLDEIEKTGKYFQFRQGLDIRLLTEQKAKRLANVKYKGDFIFAFDHIEDEPIISSKLKLWRRYSDKTTKLYLFCAYDSTDEKDIENLFFRIKVLMKYKCLPYVMRYEDYKNSKYEGMYITIARWCNQPQFYKKKSFREFCEANQQYTKTDKLCSSMRAMIKFESEQPDIAEKYFDIKFENICEY